MKKYLWLLLLLINLCFAESVSTNANSSGWGARSNCSSWYTFSNAILNPNMSVSGSTYDSAYDSQWARIDVEYNDGTTANILQCNYQGGCSYCTKSCSASGKLSNNKPIKKFRVCAQWSTGWMASTSANASLTNYSIYYPSYTLTFDANGGSVETKNKTIQQGKTYGDLPTPTRTGYTFNGWYTAASGGSQVSSLTTMGNSNTTIYAHWTINSYYLDVNGLLDGTSSSNVSGYGTFSLKVDGVVKATNTTDFYQKINYLSEYEIYDIKANTGKTYNGVSSGKLTGTMTSGNSVVLSFGTNYIVHQIDALYNGSNLVQNTDVLSNGTNYTIKTIKYCVKQTDTNTYTIGIGKNYKYMGLQVGTDGCTIVK